MIASAANEPLITGRRYGIHMYGEPGTVIALKVIGN